jgi:TatD DNase family protein
MYVDSHAHLEGKKFDADRADVLARAAAAGVRAILAIGNGTGPGSLDCAVKLAEQPQENAPAIYATTGIHPHEAKLATPAAYEEMQRLAGHEKVIAWGEIGLDYWYDHSPREVQREVFRAQMEMASAAKLPIIIHCRPSGETEDAWDDCLDMLREHWAPTGLGGVLHCFTGSVEHARRALDIGFVVSFAGNVTFPKAENIREAAKMVPLERMFIETDSPYLAPVPNRGKRNEPAYVAETARFIGELRGITGEEVGAATSENFVRFFGLKSL